MCAKDVLLCLRLDGGVTSILVWKYHTLLQRCGTLGYVVAIAALSTNQLTERTHFPMSIRADALPSKTPTQPPQMEHNALKPYKGRVLNLPLSYGDRFVFLIGL